MNGTSAWKDGRLPFSGASQWPASVRTAVEPAGVRAAATHDPQLSGPGRKGLLPEAGNSRADVFS